MSIEEVEAALENLNGRWTGEEPMTALLEDALTLRAHLKGGPPPGRRGRSLHRTRGALHLTRTRVTG